MIDFSSIIQNFMKMLVSWLSWVEFFWVTELEQMYSMRKFRIPYHYANFTLHDNQAISIFRRHQQWPLPCFSPIRISLWLWIRVFQVLKEASLRGILCLPTTLTGRSMARPLFSWVASSVDPLSNGQTTCCPYGHWSTAARIMERTCITNTAPAPESCQVMPTNLLPSLLQKLIYAAFTSLQWRSNAELKWQYQH